MNENKILFVGGGNMAEGMIKGMLKNESFLVNQISVVEIIEERCNYIYETYGIESFSETDSRIADFDVVILAVRPADALKACIDISKYISKNAIFVSICAGIASHEYVRIMGENQKILRAMPNTLTLTGHGFSALYFTESIDSQDKEIVKSIFDAIGQTMYINESEFDVFTAYSCTGPAYILYFLNAMIDSGVREGFSREKSRAIALENMIGIALKLKESDIHPRQIIDEMSSPGGTTIEAVCSMDRDRLASAVENAIHIASNHTHK